MARGRARAAAALALSTAVVLLPGCLTLLDATSSRGDRLGVFGGTRCWLSVFDLCEPTAAGAEVSFGLGLALAYVFWLDIPLCLVLDAALLPVTVPYSLARSRTPEEKAAALREAAAERKEAREELAPVDRLMASIDDPAVEDPERVMATSRLAQVGSADERVVPFLSARLPAATGEVELAILEALHRLGEVRAVELALPRLLRGRRMGSRYQPADPRLVQLLARYPQHCLQVARSAREYERPARCASVDGLGALERPGPEVTAVLEALSADSDVADAVARALAGFAARPWAQERLAAQSREGPQGARLEALRSLGAVAQPTAAACDALLAACRDADPQVRRLALTSLGHVPAQDAVPALAAALEVEALRADALQALEARGADAAPALPRLVGLLAGGQGVEVHVCRALGAMGRAASSAAPALVAAADSDAPQVVRAAIDALGRIDDQRATAALVTLLERGRQPAAVVEALRGHLVASEADRLAALILDEQQPVEQRLAALTVIRAGKVRTAPMLEALRRLAFENPDGREAPLAREAATTFDVVRGVR